MKGTLKFIHTHARSRTYVRKKRQNDDKDNISKKKIRKETKEVKKEHRMNEWRQDERVSERKEIKNWFRSLIYNTTRKGERKSTKKAKRFE